MANGPDVVILHFFSNNSHRLEDFFIGALELPDQPNQKHADHGSNKTAAPDHRTWQALGRQHHLLHGVGEQRVKRALYNQHQRQTDSQITHGKSPGNLTRWAIQRRSNSPQSCC